MDHGGRGRQGAMACILLVVRDRSDGPVPVAVPSLFRSGQEVAVEVEPATGLADEAGALVQDADAPTLVQVGGSELDSAGVVSRTTLDGLDDLEPPPPRIVVEIEVGRSGRGMPGAQEPFGIGSP